MSKKYFFLFTISTFLITVIWVTSNVYHGFADSSVDPVLKTQIEPIPASFDQAVISELKTRRRVQPDTSTAPLITPTEEDEDTEIIAPTDAQISPADEEILQIVTPPPLTTESVPDTTEVLTP